MKSPLLMIPPLRVNENLHVVLWLVKDLCWLMEFKVLGAVMVLPTVAVAFRIAWQSRSDRSDLVHALAVILWILANSTWMVGEFFFQERGRVISQTFFLSGLALLAVHYGRLILLCWKRSVNLRSTEP